jgi:hypothetical protein
VAAQQATTVAHPDPIGLPGSTAPITIAGYEWADPGRESDHGGCSWRSWMSSWMGSGPIGDVVARRSGRRWHQPLPLLLHEERAVSRVEHCHGVLVRQTLLGRPGVERRAGRQLVLVVVDD